MELTNTGGRPARLLVNYAGRPLTSSGYDRFGVRLAAVATIGSGGPCLRYAGEQTEVRLAHRKAPRPLCILVSLPP